MSLTWHMVRSDLRRLRRPLLGWLALLALTPLLGATLWWSDGGTARWFEEMADAGKAMAVMEVLVGLSLVPLLLHSDPVVSNTAFWVTRPIAPARLWRAKLGGLGIVFGLLPLLVLFPWWLVCGYGPREMALASAETLLWQVAIVALALPVAALTEAFSRYFLWLLVVVTAIATTGIFLLFRPQLGTHSAYDLVFVWSRAWLALAVFLIGGCMVAAWQFHVRRIAYSFVLFGLVAVAALAVFSFWPREFTPRPPPGADEKPGPSGGGIQVLFDKARVERVSQLNADLRVSLRITGIPEELLISPAWDLAREGQEPAQHLWTWGSGLRLDRQGWVQMGGQWIDAEWLALGLPRSPRPDNDEFWARANERRRQNGLPPLDRRDGNYGDARVQVPRAFEARTRLEPPAYRLRLHFDLIRPKLVGQGPLRVGETLHLGRTTTRLAHLDFDPQHGPDRSSTVLECSPLLLWDAGPWSLVPMLRSRIPFGPRYFIVNRARGNAVGAGGDGEWGRFGSVRIARRELSQQPPWEWRDGKWVAAENWFNEPLILGALTHDWEERFVKEIRVEKFELAPSPATGGAK